MTFEWCIWCFKHTQPDFVKQALVPAIVYNNCIVPRAHELWLSATVESTHFQTGNSSFLHRSSHRSIASVLSPVVGLDFPLRLTAPNRAPDALHHYFLSGKSSRMHLLSAVSDGKGGHK